VQPPHRYARIERERRFLLDRYPATENVVRVRRIVDRYIGGTTLRLRQQTEGPGPPVFKLTQKIPGRSDGAQQGFITTMYVSEDEYRLLARLPARTLRKTRHSVPPFGIDVFEGKLKGLVLAEAEFESAADAVALAIPNFIAREVSDDDRFTGGRLVQASRQDVRTWLSDYGIVLGTP
jgi:CYTH domain-containing protein